jgi:pimeloyl-ACP methyl ester carboxylesterase
MFAYPAVGLIAVLLANSSQAGEAVSLPTRDGGIVHAVVEGSGQRGVILAHGGPFNKESWQPQAEALSKLGFRVIAIDFRGRGQSHGGPALRRPDEGRHLDVLAAVTYLQDTGAKSIAIVGGSMGGDYAAEACEAEPKGIDRLVLLAAGAYTTLKNCKARKLFIMSRDDIIGDNQRRLPPIRKQYEQASDPKRFVVLDGTAHAQAIFTSDQGPHLMQEIVRFLSAR